MRRRRWQANSWVEGRNLVFYVTTREIEPHTSVVVNSSEHLVQAVAAIGNRQVHGALRHPIYGGQIVVPDASHRESGRGLRRLRRKVPHEPPKLPPEHSRLGRVVPIPDRYQDNGFGPGDEGLVGVTKDAVVVSDDRLLAAGTEPGNGGKRLAEADAAVLGGGGGHALRESEDEIRASSDGGVGVGGQVEGGLGD